MFLNRLKNDEIYPFFWRAREKLSGAAAEFEFVDLESLSRAVAGALSDDQLESALYGQGEDRLFSGWTLPRLRRVAERSGFACPEPIGCDTAHRQRVRAAARRWGPGEARGLRAWRTKDRVWAWRKAMRAKGNELASRARSAFRPVKLARDGLWLNLGAGQERYEGYLRVDVAGAQDLYDDIVTLSKIRAGSVARIYCNHVLEHIPADRVATLLARWREVLGPGGEVLARMPDARRAVERLGGAWEEASDSELAALGIPDYLAREPLRSGVLDDDACIQLVYGWSDSTPHCWDEINQHKILWTPGLARARFERAGFTVREARNLGTLHTLVIATR